VSPRSPLRLITTAVELDTQALCILNNRAVGLLPREVGVGKCLEIGGSPCTSLGRLEVDEKGYMLEHDLLRFLMEPVIGHEHVEQWA
jgi:hypothetical protein